MVKGVLLMKMLCVTPTLRLHPTSQRTVECACVRVLCAARWHRQFHRLLWNPYNKYTGTVSIKVMKPASWKTGLRCLLQAHKPCSSNPDGPWPPGSPHAQWHRLTEASHSEAQTPVTAALKCLTQWPLFILFFKQLPPGSIKMIQLICQC